MGVLNYLFRATEEEARAFFDSAEADFPPGVDVPDAIIRASAWAQLLAVPEDEAVGVESLRDQASEEGPWLTALPEELSKRLAGCADAETQTLAESIAQSEEAQMSGYTAEDALEAAEGMVRTAQAAAATGQGLFILMSL